MEKPLIFDQELTALEGALESWGEPGYRARQIWQGLYQNLWVRPEQFSNLPAKLRQRLSEEYRFSSLNPSQNLHSKDGETIKNLFGLQDGSAIEAVLMNYEKRRTLCISTQAGCAMGCVFCATGQMGFRRNLSSGEILEQVLYYARILKELGESITNVVIMGMGEPFHNYEATMQAIDRLNHPQGFNFGARRFTISTVGLVPAIRRFAEEQRQVNLAISLHAADDILRNSLLPINHKYPLTELMQACQEYFVKTHRRLTFEWALIQGVNDTLEQARKLAILLQSFRRDGAAACHVNIIQLNPTRKYVGQATTRSQALAFQAELENSGIPCTIRLRRGLDIQAGCGQLAAQAKDLQSP
jgi:23S rRNA (adenine2503-C2)-methyltransferase